jgi:hypothetical protein
VVSQLSPAPVNSGVRLLVLNFKNERKTCRSRTPRGSLSVRLNASLPPCAAALRGTLDAASRAVNHFFGGGERAVRGFDHRQPNNSFNPTRDSMAFKMLPCGVSRMLPRGRVNSSVRFLLNAQTQMSESIVSNLERLSSS